MGTQKIECSEWKGHRENGVPFLPGDRKHSGKQRFYYAAQSGVRGQENPCGTAQPVGRPAEVHRQFRTRRGPFDL